MFWLEITGNRVWRANADGSEKTTIASGQNINMPDGVTVDVENGSVFWTNMGGLGGGNRGTLQRLPLSGKTVETIVPVGTTNTPKQMTLDPVHHMLYWCDREGAKVWRAKLDGKEPEVLISGHGFVQLVGVALDVPRKQFYFTDRMTKKIHRAGFDLPAGETADNRKDLETLFSFSDEAMPIDLDLDLDKRQIYWTDRVRGTVHRAGMDMPSGATADKRSDVETLAMNVPDSIGISLDHVDKLLYFTQLTGEIWRAKFDGSERKQVASSGSASGISVVRMPQ